MKTSNFINKSGILGMGNSSLLILLLSSPKSEVIQIVPFNLGIINVGATHADFFLLKNTC